LVRIAAWLRQELAELSIKLVEYKRLLLMDRLMSIRQFHILFSKIPLHPTLNILIVSRFFETSISGHEISMQYRSRSAHRERLVKILNERQKPLWLVNFNDFLIHCIDSRVRQAIPDVYYFTP
jgi:hypothetical protein